MIRYVIEFGIGIDFHGQSVTRAAKKALADAVSKSCLAGLSELLGYDAKAMEEHVVIRVTVAVTRPQEVDKEEVLSALPIGRRELTVVTGGLKVPGIELEIFGDTDDSIEAAIACVEVCIES